MYGISFDSSIMVFGIVPKIIIKKDWINIWLNIQICVFRQELSKLLSDQLL